MGLDRVSQSSKTMGPIAERAKIAPKDIASDFYFGAHVLPKHSAMDIRRMPLHMKLEASASRRLHFRETYALIKLLLAEHSPQDLRHAALLALCQIDGWDRSPNKLTIEDFLT